MSEDLKNLFIYSPKDIPFGPLSNNYKRRMRLDEKLYETVTNYVYSQLLNTPQYKLSIQKSKIFPRNKAKNALHIIANVEAKIEEKLDDSQRHAYLMLALLDMDPSKMSIYQKYHRYLFREVIEIIKDASREIIKEILEREKILPHKDRRLTNALLSTGSHPIIMKSTDIVMGMDENNQGLNIYGQELMLARHRLFVERRENAKVRQNEYDRQKILDIHRAYMMLKDDMHQNINIQEYKGLGIEEIINKYIRNNKKDIVLSKDEQDSFMNAYNKGQFILEKTELRVPGSMLLYLIIQQQENMYQKMKNDVKDAIIVLFARRMLENGSHKNIEELNDILLYREIVRSAPSEHSLKHLENKLYELHKEGKLGIETDDVKDYIRKHTPLKYTNFADLSPATIEQAKNEYDVYMSKTEQKNSEHSESSSELSESENSYKSDNIIHRDLRDDNKVFNPQKYDDRFGRGKWVLYANFYDKNTDKFNRYVIGHATDILNEVDAENIMNKAVKHYNANNNPKISMIDVTYERVDNQDPDDNSLVEKLYNMNKPIIVEETSVNSRLFELSHLYVYNVDINNTVYPTVNAFIMTKLLMSVGIKKKEKNGKFYYTRGQSIISARKLITDNNGTFFSPQNMNDVYLVEKESTFNKLICYYAKEAIFHKFSVEYEESIGIKCYDDYMNNIQHNMRLVPNQYNKDLQVLLLTTGDSSIAWDDKNDAILGVGPDKKGDNIVGKILEDIRFNLHDLVEIDNFSEVDSNFFIQYNNAVWQKWFTTHANNILTTYNLMSPQKLDIKTLQMVIDGFYNPIGYQLDKKFATPKYFIDEVKNHPSMRLKLSQNYDKMLTELKNDNALTVVKVLDDEEEEDYENADEHILYNKYLEAKNYIDDVENLQNMIEELEKKIESAKRSDKKYYQKRIKSVQREIREINEERNMTIQKAMNIIGKLAVKFEPPKMDILTSYANLYKAINQNNLEVARFEAKIRQIIPKLNMFDREKWIKKYHVFSRESDPKDIEEFVDEYIFDDSSESVVENILSDEKIEFNAKNDMNVIKQQKKFETVGHEKTVNMFIHTIWSHLSSILYEVIDKENIQNSLVLSQLIRNVQYQLSIVKECDVNINDRDELSNCIGNSLKNVLSVMHSIDFMGNITTEHIRLASSIILNRLISSNSILVDSNDLKMENNEKIQKSSAESSGSVSPDDNNEFELIDEAFHDIDGEIMNFCRHVPGVPMKFSYKNIKPDTSRDGVYESISTYIDKKSLNTEELIDYFISCMNYIHSSRMSNIRKINRVNYFALL